MARYLNVEFKVWLDATDTSRLHIVSNDPRFTDAQGERPGMRIVASRNDHSADYNPNNYNRGLRALTNAGLWTPEEAGGYAPEHPRVLDKRIARILREAR